MRTRVAIVVLLLFPFAVALSPPSEPLGLGAATGVAPGTIDLAWNPPASPGASPVAGYNVYRSLTPGGLAPPVATVGAGTLAYTDPGIADGAPRFYRVSAINADGEGPLTAPVNASAKAPTTPPLNLTAQRSWAYGRGNVSVQWTLPRWNGTDNASAYFVYASANLTSDPFTYLGTSSTTAFLHTGLADNATRWYRVTAVNLYGESAPSAVASGRSPGVPNPPANFTVGSFPLTGVSIAWDRPDEGGLNITLYYLNRSIGNATDHVLRAFRRDQSGFTDFDCPITETCRYRVTARNDVGFGNSTAFLSARGTSLRILG